MPRRLQSRGESGPRHYLAATGGQNRDLARQPYKAAEGWSGSPGVRNRREQATSVAALAPSHGTSHCPACIGSGGHHDDRSHHRSKRAPGHLLKPLHLGRRGGVRDLHRVRRVPADIPALACLFAGQRCPARPGVQSRSRPGLVPGSGSAPPSFQPARTALRLPVSASRVAVEWHF